MYPRLLNTLDHWRRRAEYRFSTWSSITWVDPRHSGVQLEITSRIALTSPYVAVGLDVTLL